MAINIVTHTRSASTSVARLLTALQENSITLNYGKAVDKLTQYQYFANNSINHCPWTTDRNTAKQWHDEGATVLSRSTVKTARGEGINVIKPNDTFPEEEEAKVYTKYIKKKREFRVNIFQHEVVNLREKVRATNTGEGYIRNIANGYTTTHCRAMTDELRERIKVLAVTASRCSNSDFIGVDMIYNEHYDALYVLEVNSGPTIEGASVREYAAAISTKFNLTGE